MMKDYDDYEDDRNSASESLEEEDENKEWKIPFFNRKALVNLSVPALLIAQGIFFGQNDYILFFILLITTVLIFLSTIEIYQSNREMLLIYAKKNSFLAAFIKRRNTPIQVITCIVISILLSILFTATIKGIVMNQGFWVPVIVLLIFNYLFLYKFVNIGKVPHNKFAEENINEDITKHGLMLIKIFIPALILNFVLSFLFSAYDTYEFKTTELNLENVIAYTYHNGAVLDNGYNHYSKIVINIYLLADNIRLAFAKHITTDVFKINGFYFFFFMAFLLNFLKLMFFSWTYILLFQGANGIFKKAANRIINFFKGLPFISAFINLTKKFIRMEKNHE